MKISTDPSFDIDQYAKGTWYVHQQTNPHYLWGSKDFCVHANYTKLETCNYFDFKISQYARDASGCEFPDVDYGVQTDEEAGKLAISPTNDRRRLTKPYWVVAHDQERGFAIVSTGQPYILIQPGLCMGGLFGLNDSRMWIYTRSPVRDDALLEEARCIATRNGLDTSLLNDVDQTNCDY